MRSLPRLAKVALAVAAVLMLILLMESMFWWSVWRGVERFDLQAPPDDERTTYLLVGSDSRAFVETEQDEASYGDPTVYTGERADLLLLVQVDANGAPSFWRLPRDLVVDHRTRLALLLDDGEQALADGICSALGIAVDHMVVVGFEGLREAVDAVGGVDLNVEVPMFDLGSGLDLPTAGSVHFDGENALAYARSRGVVLGTTEGWVHEPDGESGRQGRATAVLDAVSDKAVRPPWLAMHRVARSSSDDIRVSDDASARDLWRLWRLLSSTGDDAWTTLGVDAGYVGEVPLADLNDEGRAQLVELGSHPQPCGS